MVYYKRKIYKDVSEHLTLKDITVITGLRRTGKTTLVQHLLSSLKTKNKIYLDLEKLSNREMFSDKNYDNVIQNLQLQGLLVSERMYVAIDEIQTVPEIVSVVKYLYDHYDIKFILTGSSSYYLKNLFNESLAGRKKLFELFPLDFGEFLNFKEINFLVDRKINADLLFNSSEYQRLKIYYEEYVKYGGFPKVVLAASEKEKQDILQDIISSYLYIDIKSIYDFKDVNNITNLVKMLAERVGTKLDISKLSRLTGLSRPTVENYVYLFERTYLITLVPVHTNNRDVEIVKAKKIYFNDNGLLSALSQLSSGTLFENAMFNQLKGLGAIKYFSLKNGQEIDFVLDGKIALECKETAISSDMGQLYNLSKKAGINNMYLVGRHPASDFTNFIWGGDIK